MSDQPPPAAVAAGQKLPVTVTAVTRNKGGTYTVTVAYFDGSVGQFIIPPTLATAEAVTISAMAMATLNSMTQNGPNFPGPSHRRYLPRITLKGS